MLKIKPGLVDKIIAALNEATTVDEGIAKVLGHQVEYQDSRHKYYLEAEQNVYDLIDLLTKYGNQVYSLSVLFGKLLTLPPDAIKQLTPQFQEFMDSLVKINQTLFEEQKEEGDCDTNE